VGTIPSADADFAAEARQIAGRIPGAMTTAEALDWYRLALRRVYPNAVVREQDELARVEVERPVWYVTRREHHFRIDTSIWVPLPPDAAWRLYVERVTEWQTAVELSPRRSGAAFVGREYDATYAFLGRRYRGVFRILSAEPGQFVSIEAQGSGITVWYVTSFRDEQEGTFVRVKGDYELPDTVLGRIADRLGLERAIGRDIERGNRSYRRLCIAAAAAFGEAGGSADIPALADVSEVSEISD